MNRTVSIIWIPIIAAITILGAIYFGSSLYTGQIPVTLIGYTILAILYGKLLSEQPAFRNRRRQQDSVITVTSVYTLSICLFATTTISFLAIVFGTGDKLWTLIFQVIPLIISTFTTGLNDISNEQLTEGFERRSEIRSRSLECRSEWELALIKKNQASNDPRVKNEIARIMQIIRYSSYFRKPDSWNELEKLKKAVNNDQTLEVLRGVK